MNTSKWITATRAGRILEAHRLQVGKIATAGGVRVKRLPGLSPRYHLEDIERVARESVPGRELATATATAE